MTDAYKLADRLEELYMDLHIMEAAKKLRELQSQLDKIEKGIVNQAQQDGISEDFS